MAGFLAIWPNCAHLQSLKCVVELSLASSTRRCHDNAWRDRGNAPAKSISGQHTELVAMRRPQIIHNIVFMADIIGQVNPIDIGIWKEINKRQLILDFWVSHQNTWVLGLNIFQKLDGCWVHGIQVQPIPNFNSRTLIFFVFLALVKQTEVKFNLRQTFMCLLEVPPPTYLLS